MAAAPGNVIDCSRVVAARLDSSSGEWVSMDYSSVLLKLMPIQTDGLASSIAFPLGLELSLVVLPYSNQDAVSLSNQQTDPSSHLLVSRLQLHSSCRNSSLGHSSRYSTYSEQL